MRARLSAFAALLVLGCTLDEGEARAFCRTVTCPLPADFSPTANGCYPPDFAAQCAALSPPVTVRPLYWNDACVSYDVQKDASAQISYAIAAPIVAAAFGKWTSSACPTPGMPRVGIQAVDRGPVDCAKVEYNSDQGNQHVIIFRDTLDPKTEQHFSGTNTLGLTTVTFNPATGEIYDADTEINATVSLSVGDPVSGYDFESIITHEVGHFLGLAHSADAAATMFAQYIPGSTKMRTLTADDEAGLCSIYPGGLIRNVDPALAAGGQLTADGSKKCDGEPRHGFSTKCGQPQSGSACAIASGDPLDGSSTASLVVIGLVSIAYGRARKRDRAAARKE